VARKTSPNPSEIKAPETPVLDAGRMIGELNYVFSQLVGIRQAGSLTEKHDRAQRAIDAVERLLAMARQL
jgi:hypothetical protein